MSATSDKSMQCYEKYGRPYLVSAGIEKGIKYIFTMTPLMMKVANSAEFMQCDITYDETRGSIHTSSMLSFLMTL